MPGIEGYTARPLRGKLRDHALRYRYPESVGRVRIKGGIPDIELEHDFIVKSGIKEEEQDIHILESFGLEVIEVDEPRTVWIARHDGRELKDYNQVRAPVPYDGSGQRKTGMMSSSSSGGFDLGYLFRNFMYWQSMDAEADCIIVIDETGITDKVSRDGPRWDGPDAPEMARKWFKDEMGITFTEETRTMTTYVVRKRTN